MLDVPKVHVTVVPWHSDACHETSDGHSSTRSRDNASDQNVSQLDISNLRKYEGT